jgi:hypothetical protein
VCTGTRDTRRPPQSRSDDGGHIRGGRGVESGRPNFESEVGNGELPRAAQSPCRLHRLLGRIRLPRRPHDGSGARRRRATGGGHGLRHCFGPRRRCGMWSGCRGARGCPARRGGMGRGSGGAHAAHRTSDHRQGPPDYLERGCCRGIACPGWRSDRLVVDIDGSPLAGSARRPRRGVPGARARRASAGNRAKARARNDGPREPRLDRWASRGILRALSCRRIRRPKRADETGRASSASPRDCHAPRRTSKCRFPAIPFDQWGEHSTPDRCQEDR